MNLFTLLPYLRGIVGLADAAAYLKHVCRHSGLPFKHTTRILKTIDDRTHLRVRVLDTNTGLESEWKVFLAIESLDKTSAPQGDTEV